MLSVEKLSVSIANKQVLNTVSIEFHPGKNYCILGKNWSWKSSLALTIMGHPSYQMTSGDMLINGQSFRADQPHQRAQKGIFLAFQSIPQIKGVKLFEFLRTIYNTKNNVDEKFLWFKKIILPLLEELEINKEFLRRDLNVGFSGGERRKVEILQMRLLEPQYIILDEIDSGLDIDAFKSVATLLQQADTQQNSIIIITHYFNILDYIPIDYVYVMDNGEIVQQWDKSVANHIRNHGFSQK